MENSSHIDQFEGSRNALRETQCELLEQILLHNRESRFGREHQFSIGLTPEQFRRQIPLSDYEDFRPWVDRIQSGSNGELSVDRTVAFFKTSGSTAKPKLIPVTSSLMRQKVASFAVFWSAVYRDYPAIATGTMVSNFTDSAESDRSDSGVEICSESSFWGRRGRSMHSLARWPLPAGLRLVKDNEARLYAIARLLLQTELHCIMCLNPSTLLQFCRTLEKHHKALAQGLSSGSWGTDDTAILEELEAVEKVLLKKNDSLNAQLKRDMKAAARLAQTPVEPIRSEPYTLELKKLWPMLDLVICWRSELVQPYLKQLQSYLIGVAGRDYITQSSECMMAIPLCDNESGGVLAYTQQFFEFIPLAEASEESPRTLFSWELEEGELYEIVVTTGGGLYRYRMGDCVRVNGFHGQVPKVEFRYRLGKTSSMTGEKLTEMQILTAARAATEAVGFEPEEFVCYPCNAEVPHYSLLLEAGGLDNLDDAAVTNSQIADWVRHFEQELCACNAEYEDKFESGRLGKLSAFRIKGGELEAARQSSKSSGVSEQQVKAEVLTRRFDLHDRFADAQALL